MKFKIKPDLVANITFNNTARVSLSGSNTEYDTLIVKWYSDNNFVGQIPLKKYTWGAYNIEGINNWRIEFWCDCTKGSELLATYDNNLQDKPILIIATLPTSTSPGKVFPVGELRKYIESTVEEYKCNPYVYFKGSELYDFSYEKFTPLRFNQEIPEFNLIINKSFNG
jgi:hypothetical protein